MTTKGALDTSQGPSLQKSRSHSQVGSLEVGSFHTAPIRAPIISPGLMGVVWEPYGRLPTCKLPSCSDL